MFWVILALAFLVAIPVSYGLASRIRSRRLEWPRWRSSLLAAGILPAIVIGLIVVGTIWAKATLPSGGGERGSGIAVFLLLLFGTPVALVTFIGGLIGVALCRPGQPR